MTYLIPGSKSHSIARTPFTRVTLSRVVQLSGCSAYLVKYTSTPRKVVMVVLPKQLGTAGCRCMQTCFLQLYTNDTYLS